MNQEVEEVMSEDRFEEIAEEAIRKAEKIDCDMEEFKRGLVTMWHTLNERLEIEGVNPRDPEYL